MPVVYFARINDDGPIKIGFSFNLRQRVYSLRAEFGQNLKIIGTIDGDRKVEKALHKRFSAVALGQEWFDPAPELLQYISCHADPFRLGRNENVLAFKRDIDGKLLGEFLEVCRERGRDGKEVMARIVRDWIDFGH